MPQFNTLMSYFTPKTKGSPPNDAFAESSNSSSAAQCDKEASPIPHTEYEVGDLVWGRVVGYPWWPGLVCSDPDLHQHCRKVKVVEIHVQFFDDPPSRAWIKEQSLARFQGGDNPDAKRGGRYFSPDKKQLKAIAEADKAKELDVENRLKLVVVVTDDEEREGTESEDEAMEEEDSVVVASDESLKENVDVNRRKSGRTKTKRRRIKIAPASDEDSGDAYSSPGSISSESDCSSGVDEAKVSDVEGSDPALTPAKSQRKRKKPEKSGKPTFSVGKIFSPVARRNCSTPTVTSPLPSIDSPAPTMDSPAPTMTSPAPTIDSPAPTMTSPAPTLGSPAVSQRTLFSPQVASATKSKLASFSAPDTPTQAEPVSTATLKHLTFDFLKTANLRDKDRNVSTDPEYDCRTIYIPESFLNNQTPAMRQWWEMKRYHFDTVLFFKMGKFYELFHMDATIAVKELGIIYMKGDYAHAGFPEISYGRYSDTLIQRGYKVARIEQTETPDMMDKRLKTMCKPTKFDKVVKREICRVSTKATKTFSFIDGNICDSQHDYLLAICEKESRGGRLTYGLCFVDTSIAKFQVGEFTDDRHCSRLRTLLAHHPPARILYERGHSSTTTQQIFKHNLGTVAKEALVPRTEFWDSSKTLKRLAEGTYFTDNDEHKVEWPECFKTLMSSGDSLGLTAADNYDLAVRALGAIVWYLEYSLLDQVLLSLRNFSLYLPTDSDESPTEKTTDVSFNQHMVVDGVALHNLEILHNSTGTLDGSLLQQLDHCHTPFGKRLLRQWLCSPLCNPSAIEERLDAIDDLKGLSDLTPQLTEILKKLPDLERLLSKIHSLGSALNNKDHPDSRAIFFEDVKYSKRKIEDFLSALTGFQFLSQIPGLFHSHLSNLKSPLLRDCVSTSAQFPHLSTKLEYFDNAFDHSAAKKNGVIIPTKGVDTAYDDASEDILDCQRDLDSYLEKQRRVLSCRHVNRRAQNVRLGRLFHIINVTYWGTGHNRYQLEVPESSWKNVPEEYVVMSSKKGWKRYRTPDIEDMFANLEEAEDRKASALKNTMTTIFHSFAASYTCWEAAVQCVSVLDVLMSLSVYSGSHDVMCRPSFVLPSQDTQPFVEIREGRHPCISDSVDFIPNDTLISAHGADDKVETDDGCVVIVTGPNMGGKSTLMRQVGLIVVLAQMGCYVPAEKCRLTPVDRIFTRLGATDRIMSGESTFFVELSETSAILQHATRHSLVIMDELGRGTATYDGTAIACAVVNELSTQIRCRTLFSTHYHSLVNEFAHDPTIRLGHMSCMVETDEEDPSSETITFLYKFAEGPCPKSYGFNAAKLANIPDKVTINYPAKNIIAVARRKAQEFEDNVNTLKMFQQLWAAKDIECVRDLCLKL